LPTRVLALRRAHVHRIVLAAVLAVLAGAGATPARAGGPTTGATYVALGDSYAAGEGLGGYEPGTDVKSPSDRKNLCHRSKRAYGSVDQANPTVLPDLPMDQRAFWACSGARSTDMTEPRPAGQPSQVSTVGDSTKWISISAGGNDVHFSDLGKACAKVAGLGRDRRLPRAPKLTCRQQISRAVAELNTNLRGHLMSLYKSLLDAAPSASLAVVGYPRVFPSDYSRAVKLRNKTRLCVTNRPRDVPVRLLGLSHIPLSAVMVGVEVPDAKALDKEVIRGLNRQASGIVRELRSDPKYADRIYFADTYNRDDVVPHNCTGHTRNVTVNGAVISPLGRGIGPGGLISTATFHPTQSGQQEMARALQDAFDQVPVPIRPVPASGPTLAYQSVTAGDESSGDLGFSDWSAATGEGVDSAYTLPRDPYSYRCVVLDADRVFDPGDDRLLGRYLQAGGTIVALGEHTGSGFDDADSQLNAMAATLGAHITLNDDEIDAEDAVTTNVDQSPLTENVSSVGYNWASTLTLGGSATPLLESADGSATIMASQPVGGGTFIMTGDTNAFSDANSGAYSNYDNGQLVKNICP
jgi:lysophospholipase L1-like esterase